MVNHLRSSSVRMKTLFRMWRNYFDICFCCITCTQFPISQLWFWETQLYLGSGMISKH
jgi:hypothetical protein